MIASLREVTNTANWPEVAVWDACVVKFHTHALAAVSSVNLQPFLMEVRVFVVLLLFATCSTIPDFSTAPIVDYVLVAEINTFYDAETGRSHFKQLILKDHITVVEFVVNPKLTIHGSKIRLTVGGEFREIRCSHIEYTETDYDPEIYARSLFAKDFRKGLTPRKLPADRELSPCR